MRALALALTLLLSGCALTIRGQKVPPLATVANPKDFVVPKGVAVLHYYGAGGWGIEWGDTYLLTAPYFTDHGLATLAASRVSPAVRVTPNEQLVKEGFFGTPVAKTAAVLIGHGHLDHTGDVPAFFGDGRITTRPVLIADRSTVNLLAPLADRFSCIAPIDYGESTDPTLCPVPHVRITPIHHSHAPHVRLAGLDVAAYDGFIKEPRKTLPAAAEDYKIGNTWAYLIDLLDDSGKVVFRIHYVDAAGSPPHGIVPEALLAERPVDVHIACVASWELADGYPEGVLRHHDVGYVLAAHWEDFFNTHHEPLMPLRTVVTEEGLERFLDVVEQAHPLPTGVAPLNKSDKDCEAPNVCGPRGTVWAMPVPGETYQFLAGARPLPSGTATGAR